MHSLLEKYLKDVSAQLGSMPVARRKEELREMRQHLLNAMIVNQERGQSEDEAALNALGQFGMPEGLGKEMIAAWRRGERRKDQRSFWGAAVVMTALSVCLSGSIKLLAPAIDSFYQTDVYQAHPGICGIGLFLMMILPMSLSGWISGFAFPTRAMVGVRFVVVMAYEFRACQEIFKFIHSRNPEFLFGTVYLLLTGAAVGAIVVLCAWAGSRWRLHHTPLARN